MRGSVQALEGDRTCISLVFPTVALYLLQESATMARTTAKMPGIIFDEQNANKTHSNTLPYTHQDSSDQRRVLVRMWRVRTSRCWWEQSNHVAQQVHT